MFKLLIVDDEIDTLQGLSTCINWASFGIDEVRTATNGEKGLTVVQEFSPHIVLTDIAMPRLNGVEFAKQLFLNYPEIRIIFITGYWEEEYLKSAFKSRVVDYILKPIDPDELKDAVEKILRELKGEKERADYLHTIEERVSSLLPVMKERVFSSLIRGRFTNREMLDKQLAAIGAPSVMENTFWSAISLRIKSCPWFEEDGETRLGLLEIALADALQISMEKLALFGCCFHDRDRDFACVICSTGVSGNVYMNLETLLSEFCQDISDVMKQTMQIDCTIGVGEWVEDPLLLHRSWKEAEKCLIQSFNEEMPPIIWASTLQSSIPPRLSYAELTLEEIVRSICRGYENQAIEQIDAFFSVLRYEAGANTYYCRALCVELFNSIAKAFMNSGFATQEDILLISEKVREIFTADNMTVPQTIIKDLCSLSCCRIKEGEREKNPVISQVIDILGETYQEEISIHQLAGRVFVSPSYLCLLFKQETGCTINEYLTRIRMEKAVELLDHTDHRVIDICQEVGYQDPKYFSRLFKKQIGVLPTEYRKAREQ